MSNSITRRDFFKKTTSALGAGGLLSGLPAGWRGGVYASDAPETSEMRFGIIALTDCSPIVIAHEKGFFRKYGINSSISKEASWAVIRDKLVTGENQGTHMLFGMPFASTMGLGGADENAMIIPWLINRNGQGVTLSNYYRDKVVSDPAALKPFVEEAKAEGTRLQFAMTFPPGTHAMWMRYYLATGGIHPDKDISLVTVPPPQMVANMRVGKLEGYCVGEPWNARAIADDFGYTSITSQEMWKDHPEKVCAFLQSFADKNPKTVKACLKALHEASIWLDQLDNRKELCQIISRPSYVNCPPEVIYGRLIGEMDYGDGRMKQDEDYMIFHSRNCNYPQAKYAMWWLSQFRRWGMVQGVPEYDRITQQVMRADLYEEAMKEIGFVHGGADYSSETLFDGKVFDPTKPEEYATSFSIHQLKD